MGAEVNRLLEAPRITLLVLAIVFFQKAVTVPSNGDVILNGMGSNSSSGPLQVYYNGEFVSVCMTGFNKFAADTACAQLGYKRAINYTSITTSTGNEGSGANSVFPFSPIFSIISCLSTQLHILRCNYTVTSPDSNCDHRVNLTCDDVNRPDYYKGEIRLSNGTYKSRGLLEIYLNRKWGTVCNEKFTIRIGDVICRQLGYTNAVRFGSYQFVDNDRLVWLRDLNCNNTSDLSCFKNCYDPPIIRNIYCGNIDDVGLECTFDTSLAETGSGTQSTCQLDIKEVHISIIVILIIIFCIVFLIYAVLFIGRFVVAAWHKTDRYKVQEPERRFQFDTYHEALKRNSDIQLSESAHVKVAIPHIVIENNEVEDNLSD